MRQRIPADALRSCLAVLGGPGSQVPHDHQDRPDDGDVGFELADPLHQPPVALAGEVLGGAPADPGPRHQVAWWSRTGSCLIYGEASTTATRVGKRATSLHLRSWM